MRITDNLMTDQLLRDIARNFEHLAEVRQRLSTAKRLNEASDDPVGAALAVSLRATLTALEAYQKAQERAQDLLGATGSALDQIRETLIKAKELALQGTNGFLRAEDRRILADQVNQLVEELLTLAQTRFADRFLFGGVQMTSPPLLATRDAQGQVITVTANPGIGEAVTFEVSEGVTLQVNAPGDQVFQQPVDLFQVLIGLRERLAANDPEGIAGTLDDLEAGLNQVLAVAGEVGARMGRVEALRTTLDQDLLRVRTLLSRTEDADLAQLFVELAKREQVYQASLAAGARLIQPSLLDFLR